jgi:hypothetical protein
MRPPALLRPDRGARLAAILAVLIGIAFALYTDNRWEDYYITFRPSKNLATGHGLVFQVGQHVHTYTSPLGVLLPALASVATGNQSDDAALWVFRLISIAAFAGAVWLVWSAGKSWGWGNPACWLAAAALMTDAKSVAFTINGMETGILLFFLALCAWVYARAPKGAVWWLGLSWAGLMWTRPDSFVYIAAIGIGAFLFPGAQRIAPTRRTLLAVYLKAGLLCSALYAPWLLWAWHYYGSPIPNTIVAKGLGHRVPPLWALALDFLTLPFQSWSHRFGWGIFMPAYVGSGGWPAWTSALGCLLVIASVLAFLLPRVRPEVRALSVATFAGLFYVSNTELYPWYLPPVTFLSILTLAALWQSIRGAFPDGWRPGRWWVVPAVALVALSASLLARSALQLKWQQAVIEGQRKNIGLWLRENRTSPSDTVFLESLGYIGYYSQLKMYDYPGMSSPEVIAARRAVGEDWGALIRYLQPTWTILRPQEVMAYRLVYDSWFQSQYDLVAVFDQREKVRSLRSLPGWDYLKFDATFMIYRRNPAAGD